MTPWPEGTAAMLTRWIEQARKRLATEHRRAVILSLERDVRRWQGMLDRYRQ